MTAFTLEIEKPDGTLVALEVDPTVDIELTPEEVAFVATVIGSVPVDSGEATVLVLGAATLTAYARRDHPDLDPKELLTTLIEVLSG